MKRNGSSWKILLALCVFGCGTAQQKVSVGAQASQQGVAPDTQWTSGAPLPVRTGQAAAATYDGKVYVFGGATPDDVPTPFDYPPGSFARVFAYDPGTKSWMSRHPMPVGLYFLTAHAIGNRIFIVGGYGVQSTPTRSIVGFIPVTLAYDPAMDSWSQVAMRPAYSYIFMSAVVDGRIYVIGGQGTIDNGPWESGKPWVLEDRVDIYDPETDHWSAGVPAPAPISGGVACSAGGRIYVFGEGFNGASGAFGYVYDTVNASWRKTALPPTPRSGQVCAEIGGEIYVLAGGSDWLKVWPVGSTDIYSPESDTWRPGPMMKNPRQRPAAALTTSGLFIVGGLDSKSQLSDEVDLLILARGQ